MLWRYEIELKKQCHGNNVKINIGRLLPTLPPRFGKFYFFKVVRKVLLKDVDLSLE